METIRVGVFETNSSSQHVFTTVNKILFEKCREFSFDKHVFYVHPDGDEYGEPGIRKDCSVEIMPLEDGYDLYCKLLTEHNNRYKKLDLTNPIPKDIDEFEDWLDAGNLAASKVIGKFMSYNELLHSIKLPEQVTLDFSWDD